MKSRCLRLKTKSDSKSEKKKFLLDKNLYIMSPFFFNLLKAKYLNSRLNYKIKNHFPLELEKINFKVQRNRAITGTTSSLFSCYQYFQVFILISIFVFYMCCCSFHKILKQSNRNSVFYT